MRTLGVLVAAMLMFATASKAQGVQGVHPGFDVTPIQVGVGFTFINFHEVPGDTLNNAGFTLSAMYRYNRLGLEGDLTEAVSGQNTGTSQFVFAGAGVRYFLSDFGFLRPWTEGEVGVVHVSPNIQGSSSSRAYKIGGGFDFNPLRSRVQYRVSVDIIGSSFFNTYQVSPQVSIGFIVPIGRD